MLTYLLPSTSSAHVLFSLHPHVNWTTHLVATFRHLSLTPVPHLTGTPHSPAYVTPCLSSLIFFLMTWLSSLIKYPPLSCGYYLLPPPPHLPPQLFSPSLQFHVSSNPSPHLDTWCGHSLEFRLPPQFPSVVPIFSLCIYFIYLFFVKGRFRWGNWLDW